MMCAVSLPRPRAADPWAVGVQVQGSERSLGRSVRVVCEARGRRWAEQESRPIHTSSGAQQLKTKE